MCIRDRAKYPEFSRSLSIADAVKFIRQSFYSGEPSRYGLIKSSEKSFILPYLEGAQDKGGMARAFLDDERRTTRISLQMADVGTARMDGIVAKLRTQVDSIFDPSKYRVVLTGASVIFLEGSKYMVKNLICLLYTSDAADERSSVDLGGRRIIKKKKKVQHQSATMTTKTKQNTLTNQR